MLFLVTGTIEEHHYMGDIEKYKRIRLVDANSEGDAEHKFREYYHAKSRPYDVSYYAENVDASFVIS